MAIDFGLASSHAPCINAHWTDWIEHYHHLTRNTPQPPEAAEETPEVLQGYYERLHRAFAVLRDKLAEYQPELVIIVGGDQSELFDESNKPNLMIYLGQQAWGHNHNRLAGQAPSEADIVRFTVDAETSRWLLRKLVAEEGFDVAFSTEQRSLGQSNRGLSHAFVRPAPFLIPKLEVPVVLIFENTFDAPSLPAWRCYDLGRTLARLLKKDQRRIAIYGSGGLSHDIGGPRAGWIDKALDSWFLDQMVAGNGRATTALYTFDSDTMRSGTGEIRAWVTAAGAMEEMGRRAVVVDYVPIHHAVTGLAWAYWP